MMRGVIEVNDEQLERMVDKVRAAVGRTDGDLAGITVGALGLTFKAGTDDLRESPALAIIAELRSLGAAVRAYDPTTLGELTPHQRVVLEGIDLVPDALDVAEDADVVVVFTEWPEFAKIDLAGLAARLPRPVTVVDTRNLLEPALVREVGLEYEGVGRR
jgi:UDPglucose 6-dehydrogenase